MVKRCQWGLCNSDSRYPNRLNGGVKFIPFPKPRRNLEKCKRWIKACGGPHDQLNVDTVDDNYHMFVCTKHFPDGEPTDRYPDPIPADASQTRCTPARPPPRKRLQTLARKRLQTLANVNVSEENAELHLAVDESKQENAVSLQKEVTLQENYNLGISTLDLLALAAENRDLTEKLAQQILINEELRRESTIAEQKKKRTCIWELTSNKCTVAAVRDSHVKNNFKYYTGFVYEQFMNIFKLLVPDECKIPLSFPRTITSIQYMPLKDQLLLTLIKLRLSFDFKHLANLFKLSQQDVGSVFRAWINYMFYRFGSVPIWPDREVLLQQMPVKFREDFSTTFVILDRTELKVERPSALRSQSQCYSDYKSATTLKGLVGIDPRGSFIFISMLFSGSISDKEITTTCGLLLLLQQLLECGKLKRGDGVMVDKGFLIQHEIEELGLKLVIPPFAPGGGQMSTADVALTKKIATHRVHVERAISRAKKFKIIDNKLDLCLFACVNQIWFCCCFLTGFMPLLIQD
ncbi:hypothetical protein ACJMK2_028051 [Sinanodonta woodiana]|uniref:THAP-type domain-containing protein n=1 Tax=Sinanodonta woodiana TaxID=1069815 RepID=A0ABD3X9S8_SINWO